MPHHVLKIEKHYMQAKNRGEKPFEIRCNDRGFQKGDTVTYMSTETNSVEYRGLFEITYVIGYAQKENWVVFADREIKEEVGE